MTPRESSLRALRAYFDALNKYSQMKNFKSPFETIQDVIDVMELASDGERSNDLFYFGNSVQIIGLSKARDAMEGLARLTTALKKPTRKSFYDALSSEATTLRFTDVGEAVAEGLKDTAKVAGTIALGGLGVYAFWGLSSLATLYALNRVTK